LIVEYVEFSAILVQRKQHFTHSKSLLFHHSFMHSLKKSDDDLVFNGIICRYFVKKLQVVESKMYEWWKRNVNAVRKLIDGRRASVSNLFKQSFMGTYSIYV